MTGRYRFAVPLPVQPGPILGVLLDAGMAQLTGTGDPSAYIGGRIVINGPSGSVSGELVAAGVDEDSGEWRLRIRRDVTLRAAGTDTAPPAPPHATPDTHDQRKSMNKPNDTADTEIYRTLKAALGKHMRISRFDFRSGGPYGPYFAIEGSIETAGSGSAREQRAAFLEAFETMIGLIAQAGVRHNDSPHLAIGGTAARRLDGTIDDLPYGRARFEVAI